MKNKILLSLMTCLFMLCGAQRVMAEDVTIDGITYYVNTNGKYASVTDAADTITHAKVLASVTYNEVEYPVTRIGQNAFQPETTNRLCTVELPSSITSIGSSAFQNCSKLTSINIPDGVTEIGQWAFGHCFSLTSIMIPNGITVIDSYTFHCCQSLKSVTLPDGILSIGNEAFYETSLRSLVLPASLTSIGSNVFPYTMSRLTCQSTTPPAISGNLNNISVVYVPESCAANYESVEPWASKVILDGSELSVTVNVSTPGTMGEEILNHTDYLHKVNHLTVSGTLNDADLSNIQNSMPNLLTIDMSGVEMTELPEQMFYNRKALQSVVLPKALTTIGYGAFGNCINLESMVLPEGLTAIKGGGNSDDGAFYHCTSLQSVTFPSTLKTIGRNTFYNCSLLDNVVLNEGLTTIENGAFYRCNSLKELTLSEGLTTIGYISSTYNYNSGVFESCTSLEKVVLPKSLKNLGDRTFNGCTQLANVTFSEGLSSMGQRVFQGCTSLTEVNLPNTLQNFGSTPFVNCANLSKITCWSLLPPTLPDGLLSVENMGAGLTRTLYVPEWSITKYKVANGWGAFTEILPIDGYFPERMEIWNEVTFNTPEGGFPEGYKPDMNLVYGYDSNSGTYYEGGMNLKGDAPLSVKDFHMMHEFKDKDRVTTLRNENTIEADSVRITLSLTAGKWHFLAFPYDVKVSEIVSDGDWVIRYYDGKARADKDYDNTWVTVPYDGILQAGKGYIWSSSTGNFVVPAMNNENKNNIFATHSRDIAMEEHTAEQTSDAGWNLIGNPFPRYYDIRQMDYTAPVTVWDRNNKTYTAYSPVDDDYELLPLQAFFVQCPEGMSAVDFKNDAEKTEAVSYARSASAPRTVFNLQLGNDGYADRTRFVINPAARQAYEMNCDAAKFMSSDAKAPQLYTLEGEEKFAINERPLADGKLSLGLHIGTSGTYTLSLETTADGQVILVDHLTGNETDMTAGAYTFDTEAGTFDGRFTLLVGGVATAVDEVNPTADVKIIPGAEGISVSATKRVEVLLYNAAGAQISVSEGTSARFNVAPGLYIVKVDGISYKVSVGK